MSSAIASWPRSVKRVFADVLSPNRRMFPLARSARGDRSSSVPCVRVRPHLRRALPPRIGSVDLSSGYSRGCPISFYVERDKHAEIPSGLSRGMTSDLRRSVSGGSPRRSVPCDPDVSGLPRGGAVLTRLKDQYPPRRPTFPSSCRRSVLPSLLHTPRGGPAASPLKGCSKA